MIEIKNFFITVIYEEQPPFLLRFLLKDFVPGGPNRCVETYQGPDATKPLRLDRSKCLSGLKFFRTLLTI